MAGNKVIKGFSWAAIDRITTQLSLFVVGIVIARLVSPADYGILGLLLVFVNIAQVFVDSGLGSALIYFNNLNEKDVNTTFTFNLCISVLIALILFVAAPFFDVFFCNELFHVYLRVIVLQIIINAFIVVPTAMLKIKLDFKSIAMANTVAAVASGVGGICLAYVGLGIWALIVQVILRSVIILAILCMACKWIPRWSIDLDSLKRLFRYSVNIFGASCVTRLIEEGTSFVVGKCFSPHNLGLYTRANQFSLLPSSSIGSIIISVLFPSLSRVKNNKEQFDRLYANVLKILSFLSIPLFVIMTVLAEPLVRVVLTEKWMEVVPFLQILCLGKILFPLSNITEQAINANGRSDLYFRQQVVKMITKLTLVIPAVFISIEVLVIADAISYFAAFFITQRYGAKCGLPSISLQMKSIFPYFISSIVTGAVVYGLMNYLAFNDVCMIIINAFAFLFLYISLTWCLAPSSFKIILNTLKKK